jgi:hypothetical protein
MAATKTPRASTHRKTLRELEAEFKVAAGTSFKMWAYYLSKKDVEGWPAFPERYTQPSPDWKWEQFVLDDMMQVHCRYPRRRSREADC